MSMDFMFFVNAVLFGVGLAMDAFSVSLANGLAEPEMSVKKSIRIASTFAGFQIAMPLIGWLCVHTIASSFSAFEKMIPWIALILLLYIGGKMLYEGLRYDPSREEPSAVRGTELILQGIATSIDALSVGFTIAEDPWYMALTESVIIGVVTFGICMTGLKIGRKLGMKLSGKASILGGVILIAIGLEIFLKSFLG